MMREKIDAARVMKFIVFLMVMLLVVMFSVDFMPQTRARAGEENASDVKTVKKNHFSHLEGEMRERLVKHTSEIRFDVIVESEPDNALEEVEELFMNSCRHTGVPNEGDYIYHQIKEHTCSVSEYEDEDGLHILAEYSITYFSTEEQEREVDEKVDRILDFLKIEEMSEYQKILTIYSYLCSNTSYDWEGIDNDSTLREHSAYAAICGGKAVCQGYATALYRLLLAAGIDNRVIIGENYGVAHAWNMVRLGECYYYVDATSDAGKFEFNYFMKTLSDLPGHILYDDSLDYPVAETSYCVTEEAVTVNKDGFVYCPTLDKITILSYTGNAKNVIVPSEIEGVPVEKLVQYTFLFNDDIESIEISEGIKFVSSLFVGSCSSLKEIRISSTVNILSNTSDTFITGNGGLTDHCYALENIYVEENNPYLCSIDGILYNKEKTSIIAIPPQLKVESLFIPEGVTRITDDAFAGNQYIEEVVLPESVLYIGYWAFSDCQSLRKVNIPKKCQLIGQYAFQNTDIKEIFVPKEFVGVIVDGTVFPNATTIVRVEEGNTRYKIEDNCLIFDDVRLIHYNDDQSNEICIIPESITSISMRAFMSAESLVEVVIPDGVIGIEPDTFLECASLLKVGIPESVLMIGKAAFMNCNHLEMVEVPNNVDWIDEFAFAGCEQIREIIVPTSVKHIGIHALDRCGAYIPINEYVITYTGTREEWQSIEKEDHAVSDGTIIRYNGQDTEKPITTYPKEKLLFFNGTEQDLLTPGYVLSGKGLYAIGDGYDNVPSDECFQEFIPKATEPGNYYVWYKVEGDDGQFDITPICFNVFITESLSLGDTDVDGNITPKDVTLLRRYLAGGWNVEISEANADVDKDGSITPKDVTMLRRYLAGGWGITLEAS